MSKTLWEIGDDLRALDDLLYEVGGDVSEAEAEAAIDEWLTETRRAEADKVDAYAALIKTFEARAKAKKAEARHLQDRARIEENAAKNMKERMKLYLEAKGERKVDGNLHGFTVAGTGGRAPVDIDDVDARELPTPYRRARMVLLHPTDETLDALEDQCQRLDVEPDKDAIREALEAGEDLPFARLGERGTHLRVR